MAIDRTGISSLDAGASDITYTGNEGPKSPEQQLMASADPMLVEEYQKYVFEMEEMGQTPISFREFVQQIMSGMADGGIARLGYANGQLVQPGPGRPGYQGWHPGIVAEEREDRERAREEMRGPIGRPDPRPPGGGDRDMTYTEPPGGGPPIVLNPPGIPNVLLEEGQEGYDAKANIDLLKKLKIYQTLAEDKDKYEGELSDLDELYSGEFGEKYGPYDTTDIPSHPDYIWKQDVPDFGFIETDQGRDYENWKRKEQLKEAILAHDFSDVLESFDEEKKAEAVAAPISVPVPSHISGGRDRGNDQAAADVAGDSWDYSPFNKGGRVGYGKGGIVDLLK